MRKIRRLVGGTIWKQEEARLHRALDRMRRCLNEALSECERRPISARLLVILMGRAALALNEAAAALREIELIVQSNQ